MSPGDHKPRLDGAQLTALLLETLFNGIFWVLLIQTMEVLRVRSKMRRETLLRPMPITAIVLFCTITGHWIMDFATAFQAFILPQDLDYCVKASALSPAEKVYLTLSDPKSVAGSAFYVISTLIGDGFMTYRLYIVWSRNMWIIIPPIILWVALAVTGGMVTYLFSQSQQPIFATAGPWITSCFVLTFICNLFSTSLIATKIFMSSRQIGRMQTDSPALPKVMEILIESAAMYSLCVLISLITYVNNSNVQFVMVAMTNPVIGIIFCMIVTRAHQAGSSSSIPSYRRDIHSSASLALRPVAVKISTQTQIDGEYPKSAGFGTPPASPHYRHSQQHIPRTEVLNHGHADAD